MNRSATRILTRQKVLKLYYLQLLEIWWSPLTQWDGMQRHQQQRWHLQGGWRCLQQQESIQTRPGQISIKHLTTSTQHFFATCPVYTNLGGAIETGIFFLGRAGNNRCKGLDNLLTVTMRNTQLLNRPRKLSLSSYLSFFWVSICFSYFPPLSLLALETWR